MALKLPLVINSGEPQQLQSTDACGVTVVNDTTTNATMFPLWVTANSGYLQAKVSSTKLSFNPSTGALNATQFLATNSIGIGTTSPNFILSFGTALFSGGSKLALYENAGADVYGFGVTSGSVNFYAGATQVAAFRNGSGALYTSLYRLTVGSAVFSTAPPIEGILCQGGLMLGASGDPGTSNIGLGVIPSTALYANFAGLLIGNSNISADNTIGVSGQLVLAQNFLPTGAGSGVYISSAIGSAYKQSGGSHSFFTLVSGTAGAAATLSTLLILQVARLNCNVPLFLKSYTVSILPTGVAGDTAFVTDALAPTFGATVVGGGAVKIPVYSDGTNWKVG